MKNTIVVKKRYVLKNKRRFIAILSVLLILSILIAFTSTVYSYKVRQYETIKVQQGDTLWSIAGEYAGNSDIRKAVFDIKKANDLKSSKILAGTEIKIPVQ